MGAEVGAAARLVSDRRAEKEEEAVNSSCSSQGMMTQLAGTET